MTDEKEILDPNLTLIKPYFGHTIKFSAKDWNFSVSGPEFDGQKYKIAFESFTAAKEEIEKRVTETKKIEAKNVSFNLRVINANGEVQGLTRINRATGELAGLSTREFYPNVDWIREAIRRRERLMAETTELDKAIKPFECRREVSYGRIDAESYARKVEQLKAAFAEKTRLALEAAKPELVVENLEPTSAA